MFADNTYLDGGIRCAKFFLLQEMLFVLPEIYHYLYLTGSMFNFSNNNNKVIKTVPIAAIMFINFVP